MHPSIGHALVFVSRSIISAGRLGLLRRHLLLCLACSAYSMEIKQRVAGHVVVYDMSYTADV